MGKEYSDAEAVERIAQRLIPQYHPELVTARIDYVFISEGGMKNGKPIRGKVKKIAGYVEYRIEKDFVVEVALDQWNTMDGEGREALIDHLLERCTGEEDEEDAGAPMKWKMRNPDVEEFSSIIKRHGAWNEDLRTFKSVEAKGIDIDGMVQNVSGS